MLAYYLRYNRFWLKVLLSIVLVAALAFSGIYAVLYRLSGFEYLQQQSQSLLEGSRRKVSFDADVERSLFPRPTIILKHFTLSEADGQTPAARAKEVRIGLDWRSLFGQAMVEKLVINEPVAVVSRDSLGAWSFDDLLQLQRGGVSAVNRVQINGGSLMVQAFGRQAELKEISYSQFKQGEGAFPYVLRAQAVHPAWENLALQARGTARWDEKGVFSLPELLVQFDGQENKEAFSGSLSGNIAFPNGVLTAQNNKLIIRSNRFSGHADIHIGRIDEQGDHLQISDTNSVFTGNDGSRSYNGTLTVKQAQFNIGRLDSPEITLDVSAQAAGSDSLNISIKGGAQWREQGGLQMPAFRLGTRQDQSGGVPRLIAELDGKWEAQDWQNWKIEAQGLFDRHPLTLSFQRDSNNIDGQVEMAKLNLGNYLDALQRRADNPYPQWLNNRLKANVLLVINELNLPALEVHNIRTVLQADEAQIQLSPLVADLYSGHAEGSFVISNGQPVQYTLKQKAEDVQIRPLLQDLFRNSSLSGKGRADLNFTTTGTNRRELTENLSGSLDIDVENGYWHGINVRELMQAATAEDAADNGGTLIFGDSDTKRATPFATFVLKAKIKGGVSKHRTDAKFTAPAVNMGGKGETNLYSGLMNEDISILSNNGKDTLPLRLSGSMDNPSISLNYQKITSGLSTAKEKQEAVTGALRKQWEWIKEQSRKKQEEQSASEARAASSRQ